MRAFSALPWPNSLFWRLLLGTAAWTGIALVISALVLTQAFRANAEAGFRSLLMAHSYNVMGALERDGNGRLTGVPNLRDPRFIRPLSGWSWAAFDARDRIASLSLSGDALNVPETPFDEMFRRFVTIDGVNDRQLVVMETQLLIDDSQDRVTVQVAGNTGNLEEQVSAFRRTLVIFFALFGLGLVGATALILRLGLAPLDRLREQLSAIRDGDRETIDEDQPREVQPLVREVNALLASNRDIVERARRQVGNLAHALKTPLTVLRNEAASAKEGQLSGTVTEQVETMRSQVDTYLDRARIAAVRNTARARAPIAPIVDALVRTIAKLAPHIDVSLAQPVDPALAFAGDASDLEEVLGNLLENASRFAASRVVLDVGLDADRVVFTVDDDGPGLPSDNAIAAMDRGIRLDERRSGSGLGLSIVGDIVEAYDGAVALERSPLGGLRAVVRLPYASRRN